MEFFELDGREFARGCCIPPLGYVSKKESTQEFPEGWYFQDEAEQSNGPFISRQLAAEELDKYCKREGLV